MPNRLVDINQSTIEKYVESKRPDDPEIRKELDLGYSYEGQIIELFEIRPVWNNPKEIQHIPFARIRFYKSRKLWNLYWMRASGKWEAYEPLPSSTYLAKIIEIIEEDKHGCFYG